ncbi:hypothetical protein [Yoonia sp. BS5-3]|uniref:Secreted protein n=1 Tax=Yoonia phaeophyticola TaxID=3137369 RepID=A0ABZ2V4B6_9RHOB
MMSRLLPLCLVCLQTGPIAAQQLPDPVALAEAQGVCVPFGVASARFDDAGVLRVTCADDATAFVPILGGLAPLLGAGGVAAIAAAIAGGNSTPDTQ